MSEIPCVRETPSAIYCFFSTLFQNCPALSLCYLPSLLVISLNSSVSTVVLAFEVPAQQNFILFQPCWAPFHHRTFPHPIISLWNFLLPSLIYCFFHQIKCYSFWLNKTLLLYFLMTPIHSPLTFIKPTVFKKSICLN